MKREASMGAEVELSLENLRLVRRAARKNNLSVGRVVDMILGCEISIINYAVSERRKVFKKLKLRPTLRRLYHRTPLDSTAN